MRTTSYRRHHRERIKHKRKEYLTLIHSKGYEHPTRCSCWMCGNPRKHGESLKEKLTIQEKKMI